MRWIEAVVGVIGLAFIVWRIARLFNDRKRLLTLVVSDGATSDYRGIVTPDLMALGLGEAVRHGRFLGARGVIDGRIVTALSVNEGARRAVRVIAHREGIHEHDWPAIYPLSEHWLFAAGRAIDTVLFRAGLPHVMAPALRVIFGEADVGAGGALAQESTGRRSLSSDAYLAVLEALEAGVEVGTATPTSEGFDPLGWLDGVARNLRGALALGEDVLAALAKKLRAWAKVHPELFSGEGFGTEAASMEAFVRGWEALLREARP